MAVADQNRLVMLWAMCWLSLLPASIHSAQTTPGRQVFTASSGIITDGPGEYSPSTHYEWLIDAGNSSKFISLQFVSMETECSYDYLFIYDGNSYDSTLMGTFSGSTLPQPVLARSGYMLIYLYSDRNYVRKGFYAKYNVTECPHNCSNHGLCNKRTEGNTCECEQGYKGEFCQLRVCPDYCHIGKGECSWATSTCVCKMPHTGYDCNFNTEAFNDHSTWYEISPEDTGFSPRSGHTASFVESENSLYVFGGHTLNVLLDDLMVFEFENNNWIKLTKTSPWPAPRQRHAMVKYLEYLYLFGGLLPDDTHSSELWEYNTKFKRWVLCAENSLVQPKGVTGHTLTVVENTWLYLFGGRTSLGEFISDIYRIAISDLCTADSQWQALNVIDGKISDRRLVGHSTIYHSESKSLLVYGGFHPDYAHFPKRIHKLHSFHIEKNHWSEIHYPFDDDSPKQRAFHTALRFGNYMVVYGGNAHIHNSEEICYDNQVYFYHLGCHQWISRSSIEIALPEFEQASSLPPGRFSHAAAAAWDTTILIVGGYKGQMLGDLFAYKVPTSIAKHSLDARFHQNDDHCWLYNVIENCIIDPECIWCSTIDTCMSRSKKRDCGSDYVARQCPGICGSLHDCVACTTQGQGAELDEDSLSDLWHNEPCFWCVQEATCQNRSAPKGFCSNPSATNADWVGWWGVNGTMIEQPGQCLLQDRQAGLLMLSYRHPANLSYPDEVKLILSTMQRVNFESEFDSENMRGGMFTNLVRGYIHPLRDTSSESDPIRVSLSVSTGTGTLQISTDDTPGHLEVVANVSTNVALVRPALRDGDPSKPIFPNEERGYRYYFEHHVSQAIAGPSMVQLPYIIQLDWTGAPPNGQMTHQGPITAEFLQPYWDISSCMSHDNCKACMSNQACTWCMYNNSCLNRAAVDVDLTTCSPGGDLAWLVLAPANCPVCSDHVQCQQCATDPLCEWLTEGARCLRRGRYSTAIRDEQRCTVPCQQRTNCSSCMSEKDECAWCEETKVCFAFVEYMLRFSYGGCTHWIDSMSNQSCHDCSRHSTCSGCLSEFQCGWCGNDNNPMIGSCVHGDHTGADSPGNCSVLVALSHDDVDITEPASWSNAVCPDVEECRLELDDCHENASCYNTFESYECECNKGFKGDGVKSCERTCYHECVHGYCSEAPDFTCMCVMGWAGVECNTSCGCNFHSTCEEGIGICDSCSHWTMGQFCDTCQPGSYGDATNSLGCHECQCHGHAEESLNFCDNQTGQCHCKDNTDGNNCEKCAAGFYGNPRNGGRCYRMCEGRMVLTNVTHGNLGSYEGAGVVEGKHANCLWILTVSSGLEEITQPIIPTISFTMLPNIQVDCARDFVYIYDGIPDFILGPGESTARLLGAFCGYGLEKSITVEAASGFLTIIFTANIELASSSRGFNATYQVNDCPDACFGNRACVSGECVCQEGWTGADCMTAICPNDCSQLSSYGTCNETMRQCVCEPGYAGDDCSEADSNTAALYTNLFNPSIHDDPTSPLSRMGHSVVTCDNKHMLMFGGYSYKHGTSNDLWSYDKQTGEWKELKPASNSVPSPRYFHAAVCVSAVHAMFVYGGISDMEGTMHEMWRYNIDSSRWSKLEVKADVEPMAGHTMTMVDDTVVTVIGGISLVKYYSKNVYKYDASNNQWTMLEISGSGPTGLFGHSAVYHENSSAIYVFGGYEYQLDKTIPSNRLYALDFKKHSWTLLPSMLGNKPVARFLHSAAGMKNYMVIIGGRLDHHEFDNSILAYCYACNTWTNISEGVPRIIGEHPPSVIGAASVLMSPDEVYVVGGVNSLAEGMMTSLRLPEDLCVLIISIEECVNTLGCDSCTVLETNKSYCYSNGKSRPAGCLVGNTTVAIRQGTKCDTAMIEHRNCTEHKYCFECLAHWPSHSGHNMMCKWCTNCETGLCIHKDENCTVRNPCTRRQQETFKAEGCQEHQCQATDCDHCEALEECIWTRQFIRSSEIGRTLSKVPFYDWNCVMKSLLGIIPYIIQSSPPDVCPMRCYQYTTCEDCLNSKGSEGGAQSCIWASAFQECMPPAYFYMRCSGGQCRELYHGQEDQCPLTKLDQCSDCLSTSGSGWCSVGGLDGIGECMKGGMNGALGNRCRKQNFSLPADIVGQAVGPPSWNYFECPLENECENGHHNCDESEECQDLPKSFDCHCRAGYKRNKNKDLCQPECVQGCGSHGACVEPNKCACQFGYIGHNCSTECECNKHSNCESVIGKDICLQCLNHTQGSQCEECQVLYVGNPVSGGSCKSCVEFCHHHSAVCLTDEQYKLTQDLHKLPHDPRNISLWLGNGPNDEDEAKCLDCQNNTEGRQCSQCKAGYFRLEGNGHQVPCQPCRCNGHGHVCQKDGGTHCECHNNTVTPHDCNDVETCYKQQCSRCIENFLGTPTDGHHCYRTMTVDMEYCFDPITQMTCPIEPSPLPPGRTVFFGVQPRFINVDIRIVVDVTVGGVDLYFSPEVDSFLVETDKKTGVHRVLLDPKYQYVNYSAVAETKENVAKRDTRAYDESDNTTHSPESVYTVQHMQAHGIITFIKVEEEKTLLVVKNITNRLVITLPSSQHDLNDVRFFIIVFGVGDQLNQTTYGNLFFFQNQPHIDLFVFFSVFFSCFFLFLALCVLVWKTKQAVDTRRSWQRRRLEMQHMAQRPFSRMLVLLTNLDEVYTEKGSLESKYGSAKKRSAASYSPPLPSRKHRLPKLTSRHSLTSHSSSPTPPPCEEMIQVNPLAVEPVDDGIAAVASVMMVMPGSLPSTVTPVCLASSLVTMRIMYQNIPPPPPPPQPNAQKPSLYIRQRPTYNI